MYLMAYPMIPKAYFFTSFIIQNNMDINYQNYLGRTPIIDLINNKKNIIKICSNNYYETLNSFILLK